jgi:hypothetical protein
VANYQQVLGGGEEEWSSPQIPDPALQRRLARRDLNRSLVETGGTSHGAVRRTPNMTGEGPVIVDSGIPRAQTRPVAVGNPLHPFDRVGYQRLGKYEEVPTDTLYTAQRGVDRRRVQELIDDPAAGVNPRKPYEKPMVLRTNAKVTGSQGFTVGRKGANVLINGNHRVASEMAKGAMFIPAQVVEDTPENQRRSEDIEYQRGMLDQTMEASRALRDTDQPLTGVALDRTKTFVESTRRAYRDA